MKVLVIDDEQPARARMIRILGKDPELEIIGEAANGAEALDLIESTKPDAVFLDIEMPELDGFGVAKAVVNMPGPAPEIIFVTAFSEFAVQAFEVNAIDYVLKPVNEARLSAAIERLKRNVSQRRALEKLLNELPPSRRGNHLALKIGAKYVLCDPDKISALTSQDHYSVIHLEGRELLSDASLDTLLRKLDNPKFMRVHRSGVINIEFLKELENKGDRKYIAILSDVGKTMVPISRDKLGLLKARLAIR